MQWYAQKQMTKRNETPKKAKVHKTLNDRFVDIADWISEGMGKPANIIAWLIIVVGWTGAYALHPALANVNFLPAWFTSQAYNFPLNLVTTVMELFIGFFIAASSNRVEKRNRELHEAMLKMIKHIEEIDEKEEEEIMQLIQGATPKAGPLAKKSPVAKKKVSRAKK